jgi:hypothetical protein
MLKPPSGNPVEIRTPIYAALERYFILFGIVLPIAYVVPMVLSELSGYFARLAWLAWTGDLAALLSLPWEVLAAVLLFVRWRDLSQRFWILFFVNGFRAYTVLPIYRMHFGLYR